MIIKILVTIGLSHYYLQFQKFLKKKMIFLVLINMVLGLIGQHTWLKVTFIAKSLLIWTINIIHSLGIFLDLSKAFDTLNHDIFLHKLNVYGIRGLANSWIKNYFPNRRHLLHTKIQSDTSV